MITILALCSHFISYIAYKKEKYDQAHKVLRYLKVGDMVEFKRTGRLYSHMGVYLGGEFVIHLTGDGSSDRHDLSGLSCSVCSVQIGKACVKKEKLEEVAKDGELRRSNKDYLFGKPRPEDEILEEAETMIGRTNYNIFTFNCEHFATSLRYGKIYSTQVMRSLFWVCWIPKAVGILFIFYCLQQKDIHRDVVLD